MADGDLLSTSGFQSFKDKTEDWFLGAAGDVIRDRCGWHIFPERTEVNYIAPVSSSGVIVLPTLNLVSVQEIRWAGVVVPEYAYTAEESGVITFHRWHMPYLGLLGPYRSSQGAKRGVSVDFTHGFAELPRPVAEVGFELTARTMEKPAGVAKSLNAGPNAFVFNEFGMVLTEDQENRLGPYTIVETS